MRAKRLHIRLFLEGQEVPVISAVVSGGVGQPATATIQVVPTDNLHGIKPRTLVHLFFFDLHPNEAGLAVMHKADITPYDQLDFKEKDSLGDNYKLLFVGEVISYIFEKREGERIFLLQCSDLTGYWDIAKQFFHTGGTRAAAKKTSAFIGSSSTSFSGGRRSSANAIVKILTQKPSTTETDGLLGGIAHLLESVGGVFKGKGRRFRGLNDFFSAAELRLKFTQMLGISPKDNTSAKLLNHKTFKKWLKYTIARQRGLVSFRELIQLLLGRIFHQYTSIPAPYFRTGGKVKVAKTEKGALKITGTARKNVKKRISALKSTLKVLKYTKPKKTWAVDKAEIKAEFSRVSNGRPAAQGVIKKIKGFGSAKALDKAFLNASSSVNTLAQMDAQTTRARKALRAYRRGLNSRAKGKTTMVEGERLDRLFATVFNPNIWFAPPPRCNVIFPDFYESFSYRRNFLEEITRSFLTTQKRYSKRGSDPFRSAKLPRYFAPDLDLTPDDDKVFKSMAQSAKKGIRFILPHEIFTGIIAKFDHMSDVGAFRPIGKQGPAAEVDPGKPGKMAKVNYLQRVANYLFFLYRYGPRVITLDMHFHPYLVPGVPALILDRYYSPKELETLDMRESAADKDLVKSIAGYARASYLGLVHGLTHSISQDGGTTTAIMSHCRTHEESMEGLKGFGEATVRYDYKSKTKKHTEKYSYNKNVESERVGQSMTNSAAKSTKTHLSKKHRGFKVRRVEVSEEPDRGGLYGKLKGDKDIRKVTITYFLARTTSKERSVKFPFEQAVFPGWMSPIYSRINIGRDFYHEMFGIASICDPVTIATGGAEPGSSSDYLPGNISAKEANSLTDKQLAEQQTGEGVMMITSEGELIGEIELGSSVYEATEGILHAYSTLKAGGHDIDTFFKDYGYREIATLRQVLGGDDFNDGVALTKGTVSGKQFDEGFHTRAFGPYQDMEGLDWAGEIEDFAKARNCRQIDAKIDPRLARMVAVVYYKNALEASQGQIG